MIKPPAAGVVRDFLRQLDRDGYIIIHTDDQRTRDEAIIDAVVAYVTENYGLWPLGPIVKPTFHDTIIATINKEQP